MAAADCAARSIQGAQRRPATMSPWRLRLILSAFCVFVATGQPDVEPSSRVAIAVHRSGSFSTKVSATAGGSSARHLPKRRMRREESVEQVSPVAVHPGGCQNTPGSVCVHGVPVSGLSSSERHQILLASAAQPGASFAQLAEDLPAEAPNVIEPPPPDYPQEIWNIIIKSFNEFGEAELGTNQDCFDFCDKLKTPVICVYTGSPSDGGVPFVSVRANVMQLENIMRENHAHIDTVEKDLMVYATSHPDVPHPYAVQARGLAKNLTVVRGQLDFAFVQTNVLTGISVALNNYTRKFVNNNAVKLALDDAISSLAGVYESAGTSTSLSLHTTKGVDTIKVKFEIRPSMNTTSKTMKSYLDNQSVQTVDDGISAALHQRQIYLDVDVSSFTADELEITLVKDKPQDYVCSVAAVGAAGASGGGPASNAPAPPIGQNPNLPPNTSTSNASFLAMDSSQPTNASKLAEPPWHLIRINSRLSMQAMQKQNTEQKAKKPKGGGRDVHVYLMDTGVSFTHAELAGHAVPTFETYGGYVRECDLHHVSCASDEHGHGTSMASLVMGTHYGVATGVILHSVKVVGRDGTGWMSNLIKAVDWIMQHAQEPAIAAIMLTARGQSRALEVAVELASKHQNITVVTEAGDAGEDACDFSPAFIPAAITVGATNKEDRRPIFANRGPCVDVVAPGSGIEAADIRGDMSCRRMSSSGASAAQVVGAIALVLGDDKGLIPEQAERILLSDATGLSNPPVGRMLFIGPPGDGRPAPGTSQKGKEPWYPYDVRKWSQNVPGYNMICKEGKMQSPVELPRCDRGSASPLRRMRLQSDWRDRIKVEFYHHGRGIRLVMKDNITTTVGIKKTDDGLKEVLKYNLMHCEFHIGSEHTIQEVQQDLELQCLHERVVKSTCGVSIHGYWNLVVERKMERLQKCDPKKMRLKVYPESTMERCEQACNQRRNCNVFEFGGGSGRACALFRNCSKIVNRGPSFGQKTFEKCLMEDAYKEKIMVSFLFQVIDIENQWLALLEDHVPSMKAVVGKYVPGVRNDKIVYISDLKEIDMNLLWEAPYKDRYWTYRGSLTTPPCTEGIKWFVFGDPLPMSRSQLDKIANAMDLGGENFRPVQEIGARCVDDCSGICSTKPIPKFNGMVDPPKTFVTPATPMFDMVLGFTLAGLEYNMIAADDRPHDATIGSIRTVLSKFFGVHEKAVDVKMSVSDSGDYADGRRRRFKEWYNNTEPNNESAKKPFPKKKAKSWMNLKMNEVLRKIGTMGAGSEQAVKEKPPPKAEASAYPASHHHQLPEKVATGELFEQGRGKRSPQAPPKDAPKKVAKEKNSDKAKPPPASASGEQAREEEEKDSAKAAEQDKDEKIEDRTAAANNLDDTQPKAKPPPASENKIAGITSAWETESLPGNTAARVPEPIRFPHSYPPFGSAGDSPNETTRNIDTAAPEVTGTRVDAVVIFTTADVEDLKGLEDKLADELLVDAMFDDVATDVTKQLSAVGVTGLPEINVIDRETFYEADVMKDALAKYDNKTKETVKKKDPFDCEVNALWSGSKKYWCCKHKKIGCPREPKKDKDGNEVKDEDQKDEEEEEESGLKDRGEGLVLPAWKRDFGNKSCPCVGIAGLPGSTYATVGEGAFKASVSYPMDVGSSCHSWDDARYPGACTNDDQEPGAGQGWCAQPWCYVDPCNCNIEALPTRSKYFEGVTFQGHALYYSYETCGGNDYYGGAKLDACVNQATEENCVKQSQCAWSLDRCLGAEIKKECSTPFMDYQVIGKEECRCVGFRELPGTTSFVLGDDPVEYPAADGAICSAWDNGNFPAACTEERASKLGPGFGTGWCAERWCFIDPCHCDFPWLIAEAANYLPSASFQGRPLAVSYATCDDIQSTPTKEQEQTLCKRYVTAQACAKQGAKICEWTPVGCRNLNTMDTCRDVYYANAETTTTTSAPAVFAGNSNCPCIGLSGLSGETQATVGMHFVSYPMDAGTTCQQWDNGRFKDACQSDEEAPGLDNGWCRQSWCYVDPCTCNLKTSPVRGKYFPNARFKGRPLFYSYETCGEEDVYTRDERWEDNQRRTQTIQLTWKTDGFSVCSLPLDHSSFILGKNYQEFPNQTVQTCMLKCETEPFCAGAEVPRFMFDHESDLCLLMLADTYVIDCNQRMYELFSVDVQTSFNVKPKYHNAGFNTSACPTDYAPMVDMDECRRASMTFYPRRQALTTNKTNNQTWPHGCIYDKNTSQLFVNIPHGDPNSAISVICKRIDNTKISWSWRGNMTSGLDMLDLRKDNAFAKYLGDVESREEAELAANTAARHGMQFASIIYYQKDYGSNGEWKGCAYGVYEADVNKNHMIGVDVAYPVDAHIADPRPLAAPRSLLHEKRADKAHRKSRSDVHVHRESENEATAEQLLETLLVNIKERAEHRQKVIDDSCAKQLSVAECQRAAEKGMGCRWLPDPAPGKCVDDDVFQACTHPVDHQVFGQERCRCVGIAHLNGLTHMDIGGVAVDYPGDAGSTCRSWDYMRYPGKCTEGVTEPWCLHRWCYVDRCQCEFKDFEDKVSADTMADAESTHITFQGRPVYKYPDTCFDMDNVSSRVHAASCMYQLIEEDCNALNTRLAEKPGSEPCAWTGTLCVQKRNLEACTVKYQTTTTTSTTILLGYAKCPCIGVATLDGVTTLLLNNKTVEYPQDFGAWCRSWDDGLFPGMCERKWQNPGFGKGWCKMKWCYVDPCNCNLNELPRESKYLPYHLYQGRALYYSYETCGNRAYWSGVNNEKSCRKQKTKANCNVLGECMWADNDEPAVCVGAKQAKECEKAVSFQTYGRMECRCIGIAVTQGPIGKTMATYRGKEIEYPGDVGSHCFAWDAGKAPKCSLSAPGRAGPGEDDACGESWCFVDPCTCKLATPSIKASMFTKQTIDGKPLYLSYATCGGKGTWSNPAPTTTQACSRQLTETACVATAGKQVVDPLDECVWTGYECLRKELVPFCAKLPGLAPEEDLLGNESGDRILIGDKSVVAPDQYVVSSVVLNGTTARPTQFPMPWETSSTTDTATTTAPGGAGRLVEENEKEEDSTRPQRSPRKAKRRDEDAQELAVDRIEDDVIMPLHHGVPETAMQRDATGKPHNAPEDFAKLVSTQKDPAPANGKITTPDLVVDKASLPEHGNIAREAGPEIDEPTGEQHPSGAAASTATDSQDTVDVESQGPRGLDEPARADAESRPASEPSDLAGRSRKSDTADDEGVSRGSSGEEDTEKLGHGVEKDKGVTQSGAGGHDENKESEGVDSSAEGSNEATTTKVQAEDGENVAKAEDGVSMAEMKKPKQKTTAKLPDTHSDEKEQEALEAPQKDSEKDEENAMTSSDNTNIEDDLGTGMFTTTTYILAAICVLALLAIAWILLRLKELGAFAGTRERRRERNANKYG